MNVKKYIHITVLITAALYICTGCGSEKTMTEQQKPDTETSENAPEKETNQQKTNANNDEKEDHEKNNNTDTETSGKTHSHYEFTTGSEARAYMDSCTQEPDRTNLLRYEEDYIGKDFAFIAEVSQIIDGGTLIVYDDADGDGIFADGQYALIDKRSFDTTRILEDDKIAVYGQYAGTAKFSRAIGDSEVLLPQFYMYVCNVEGVELEPDEKTAESMDYMQYADIVADTEDGMYTLYDIDNDGICELITSYGWSSTNWFNTVYTMDVYGQITMIGEFYGAVSLYEAEDGGLYSINECIGYESADWITKNGSQLDVINITSGQDVTEYKNEHPVFMADTNDLSLLNMQNSFHAES